MTDKDTESKHQEDHLAARNGVISEYGHLWRQAIAKSGVADIAATDALLQLCAACYLDGVGNGSTQGISMFVEEHRILEQESVDERQEFSSLLARAEKGDADAQFNLGGVYFKGEGVAENLGEAVKWYRLAADQGFAQAQFNLGVMYANGQGVPKRAAVAVKWFRLAADQGDAGAQYNFGVAYANGEGVPKSAAEAVKWFRRAADQGDAGAQHNLGVAYANGEGVPKSAAEAVKWYRLAADQGHVSAQLNLGAMYGSGEGVPKSGADAAKWFFLAANQGNAKAQANLGNMYANGEGVPKNAAEAVKWYRLAANQGNAKAQCNLGLMYRKGEGVPKSDTDAVKWNRLAADQGDSIANKGKAILEKQMAHEQIVEAQRRLVAAKPVVAAPAQVAEKAPKGKSKAIDNEGSKILSMPERRPATPEERQTQLKKLIALGREQGYLTYSQMNDFLPTEMVDPDQIEEIGNTLQDMGIPLYEKAPENDALLAPQANALADDEALRPKTRAP